MSMLSEYHTRETWAETREAANKTVSSRYHQTSVASLNGNWSHLELSTDGGSVRTNFTGHTVCVDKDINAPKKRCCSNLRYPIQRRTPYQYLQLAVFYTIFYACLIGFCASMYIIFMYNTLDENYPYQRGSNSLLNLNPGIGIVPITDRLTTLIHFRTNDKYSYRQYSDAIMAFTQWYEYYAMHAIQSDAIIEDCNDGDNPNYIPEKRVCHYDLNIGGHCNPKDNFGYRRGSPCFIVTLNRVYGWLPDPVVNQTGVLIKCAGAEDTDDDAMGPLCYYDQDTLNLKRDDCKRDHGIIYRDHFPYVTQRNYRPPFVFVKMLEPKRMVVMRIVCWAIARNIVVDKERREGAMAFEMIID